METREIKLTLDTATRWYNGNDAELKELALTTFPELGKKSLPKSWEELKEINGYWVNANKSIELKGGVVESMNKNTFATKEQAEASIALAQLSQLMKVYNGDWVADWSDENLKYIIYFGFNKIMTFQTSCNQVFLAFKDAETRDLFLENFRDLILTAKPLL
jgi:hypothetical protein